MTFKTGFYLGKNLYGWHKKDLWRLPSKSGNRNYSFKKLNTIVIGNKVGYRVSGKPKTIEQLQEMTMLFQQPIIRFENKSEDTPF